MNIYWVQVKHEQLSFTNDDAAMQTHQQRGVSTNSDVTHCGLYTWLLEYEEQPAIL